MSSAPAQVMAWSFGLAAAFFLVFGMQLLGGGHNPRRTFALRMAAALSLAWAAAGLAFGWTGLWFAWWSATLLDSLRIGAWLFFLFELLTPESGSLPAAMMRVRNVLLSVVVVRVIVDLGVPIGLGATELAGQLTFACALASGVAGLVGTEQLFRNFPAESRWSIKPLCLGLVAAFFFDIYVFAEALLYRRMDLTLWAARGIAAALAVPLVAVSAARSRDWDFRISLSRQLVFHSAALALAGVFLIVVAAAGYWVRYFGGEWGRALQAMLLFSGLLAVGLLFFSGSARSYLRVSLSKHLFRYRYDYRAEWLRFTQGLVSGGATKNPAVATIGGLADMVESTGGLLWMADAKGVFVPRARLNHPEVSAIESADSPLIGFLRTRQWIVDLEQLRSQPSVYDGFKVPAWLEEVPDAWLIVPLLTGEDLVGFAVLLTARTRFEVDWEVLDLLKTAARQAAVQLAGAQAAEALLEAQKFDSFNRMSAFVVHDLKNLVAQMHLMLRNADRHAGNPEFQQDMLDTVRHVHDRMKALMQQLQEKRSIDPAREIELGELMRRVALGKRHQQPQVSVDAALPVRVMGHPERMERVLAHLVQNALDATEHDGIVGVRVSAEQGDARIEIHDTGCGMSPQFVRERLFKPFQTTKDAGMGIGTYETFQYVTELGGRMEVDSEPGRGTRIAVFLPAAAPSAVTVSAA